MGRFPFRVIEQNGFARRPDGSFWPAHALIDIGLWVLALTIAFFGLRWALPVRWRWMAAVVFLWGAWLHWVAAWDNLRLHLNLWVDLP